MKVKTLIEQLQKLPQDAPVYIFQGDYMVADACEGAGEDVFIYEQFEGGNICDDLVDADVFVGIRA